LSDMSQEEKDNIDTPKMQSLEDLLKGLDTEENKQPIDLGDTEEEDKFDHLLDNLIEDEEDIDEDEE
jgi:translocation protein SEC62